MRRAAATACPICSRRGSPGGAPFLGAPPRPGPDSSRPGPQQGAARSNPALQPPARPHSPGTSGRPRPSTGGRGRGRAARASTVHGRPCFALYFFDGLLGRPGEREDGDSRLGSASPLSILALGHLRPPGSSAPVRALMALGVAPNGGSTVLPGPPTWPSSLGAARSPGLGTRGLLPLSQWPPQLDSKLCESAGLCAGQDAVRGSVRPSRPVKREPGQPARPRRPPRPHLHNLGD